MLLGAWKKIFYELSLQIISSDYLTDHILMQYVLNGDDFTL